MTAQNKSIAAIVPAAGMSTRMKSKKPKFLHDICGRSIISHIVYSLIESCDEIVVVIGNCGDEVTELVNNEFADHTHYSKIRFATQKEMLGSADAVRTGLEKVSESMESIFVQLGDVPLMTKEVVSSIISKFNNEEAKLLVATAILDEPFGYGRIVRNDDKKILKIVEQKDCDDKQKEIKEANMFPFVFAREFLESSLPKIKSNNQQKELYLTDCVEIASNENEKVASYIYEDVEFAMGINDRSQLAEAEKVMRARINEGHMKNGVTIIDPENTYIDAEVEIENDVTITPGTVLKGKTKIGSGSVIDNSKVIDSVLGANVTIGPMSYLRPGTVLEDNVHIGTSVEIKNSKIGKGSKIPHLSYIGDCTTGENCNLGAGTTTANYDGKNKHQTILGNDVKLGVNTVIVAPVKIGNNVYSAAGAVITKDIPDNALAKGVPATIVENWTPPSERA